VLRLLVGLGFLTAPKPALAQTATSAVPEARAHHQLVYHAGERRVYLVGGSTRSGGSYHFFDDAWSWDGAAWTPAAPLPFPRSSHGVAYHADRNAIVLFGGGSGQTFAADTAVYVLRGGSWSMAGAGARGFREPAMCHDPVRSRTLLFGGWGSSNEFSGSTWEWDGTAMSAVEVRGPGPRAGHALTWDPLRGHCILFGGRGEQGYLADTSRAHGDSWVWDGRRWERLTEEGPPPRGNARLAFDGSGVILFGGRVPTPGSFYDLADTCRLEGRQWVRLR
jgi:hypothetical protein